MDYKHFSKGKSANVRRRQVKARIATYETVAVLKLHLLNEEQQSSKLDYIKYFTNYKRKSNYQSK